MAINKVEFGGNTLIDITDTTATAADVLSGKYFYTAAGVKTAGTGSGVSAYAYVVAEYPSGSTATCTNSDGAIILSSTMTLFLLSSGTTSCTVTATLGAKSRTKNVSSIVSGGSYYAHIVYELILYSYGAIETEISGGLTKTSNNATVEYLEAEIRMRGTYGSSTCAVYTVNKIDVTGYDSLIFSYKNDGSSQHRFGLATAVSASPTYATPNYTSSSQGTFTNKTLDISSLSGKYYVATSLTAGNYRHIYEMKLV